MVYLVSGLPLGVVSFIVAVGGTVAGVVLLPLALVGVPVLVGPWPCAAPWVRSSASVLSLCWTGPSPRRYGQRPSGPGCGREPALS